DQLAHRAAVGDEIVIDEINRGRKPASAQLVELRDDLLRPLHARHPAIEARNIAELAREGAAGGKLDRAEEIIFEAPQLIGRERKLLERQTLTRLQLDLGAWTRAIARQHGEQFRGGVADLANVDIVEFRIKLRARRDRRTAQHGGLSGRMGAAADVD